MSVRKMSAFALICAFGVAAGCDRAKDPGPVTEGQIIKTEGRLQIEKGKQMEEGEKKVVEGKAQKAKGEAMVQQGKRIQGEREIREGEMKITEGEALIKQAEEMKTELEVAPRSSSRSAEPRSTGSESTIRVESDDAEVRDVTAPRREPATIDADVTAPRREPATIEADVNTDTDNKDGGAELDVDIDADPAK